MNKIRRLRVEHGWTQEELGEMLNVHKAAVSKYENERAFPSNEVLKALSSIFNVSIDYLLDNENNVIKEEYQFTSDQIHLLKKIDSLSADGKKLLKILIESLTVSHAKKAGRVTKKHNSGYNVLTVGDGRSVTMM